MEQQWFGAWVANQRESVYGWSQAECAARVQQFYDVQEEALPVSAPRTTFSRCAWGKIELNRKYRRVRESTVQHVSIGLCLPLVTCQKMAGYRPLPDGAEDPGHAIGRCIRLAREQFGLPAELIADSMGVSPEKYRQWELGATVPDAVQIWQISQTLNVGIQDLYDPIALLRDRSLSPAPLLQRAVDLLDRLTQLPSSPLEPHRAVAGQREFQAA